MRNGYLILLSMLGLAACDGAHLHVGDDTGSGGQAGASAQAGSSGQAGNSSRAGSSGQAGAAAGTGGTIVPPGTGGVGAAGGQPGTGGASGTVVLSVTPSSASFASTLVEAVSTAQTFTVRNEGDGAAAANTVLAALAGSNAADFKITSNQCGTTLQPGASCDVAIAFAPRTRSGSRTASLAVSASSGGATTASLSGTALPSLGLLAGGLGGYGNGDGTGADARFESPAEVASDGAGNLFLTDSANYTIRKMVVATGAVTTFAGTSQRAGTDDGVGAAARFSNPQGITSDGAGNLFVTDSGLVRKIVIATGAVTTVTGDTGSPLHIPGASGIVSDGANYLYVAENGVDPHTDAAYAFIRRVSLATGTVTTLADRTGVSVPFDVLYDMVSDRAGNLYLTDGVGVAKVVIATGAVTTLPGLAGYGLALDGAGSLYVTTNGYMLGEGVQRLVLSTGVVTTLAGAGLRGSADGIGAAAGFNRPQGITSDGAGNLFVAEVGNDTIRRIVIATGAVTTLAGRASQEGTRDATGAAARFGVPLGVATDGAGNLFVSDVDANSIRKVVLATGAVTTLAGGSQGSADGVGTAASFYIPNGIATDGAGNLFVTDSGSSLIRKIVIATGAVTTLAGSFATSPGIADGIGAAASFNSPGGITADGMGNLYVADTQNYTIRKIVIATAAVTTLAGQVGQVGSTDGVGTAATFYFPCGIATDGAGNLYVADDVNNTIRRIVIATGAVTTFAGEAQQSGTVDGVGTAARFSGINGLVSDGAGSLYVTDGGLIRKIALGSATVSTPLGTPGRTGVLLGALPASLNGPTSLAILPSGELAVVDEVENSVLLGHL